jgi:hypothetical protein
MSQRILQINFTYRGSASDLAPSFESLARPIADTNGLRWKIWLLNEATREAGGIYLFDDEASLNAYLAGPIVAQVKGHPALSNITAKQFGTIEPLTAVTRGPLQ